MASDESAPKRQKFDPDPTSANVPRSIDACQRCRTKKVKCDQNFPTCARCHKAGVDCVGVDRATGRAIPRSYIHHLEQKIVSLETVLKSHGVSVEDDSRTVSPAPMTNATSANSIISEEKQVEMEEEIADPEQAPGSSMYLGASSGITFAKLVTAAVKMKEQGSRLRVDPSKNPSAMDQSPAVLPPKSTAQQFVRIYFNHSNSQLPILHRETFLTEFFEPIYGTWDDGLLPLAQSFTMAPHLSGTFRSPEDSPGTRVAAEETWIHEYKQRISQNLAAGNQMSAGSLLLHMPTKVPEKFHRPLFYLNIIFAIASSVNHLQYVNSISEQFRKAGLQYVGSTQSNTDPLEQLQAKLLLAVFSLMRPCKPGIWYVIGQCLRICVDLGLHNIVTEKNAETDAFTKDRKRRLFWCTYSLDRQICFYMGRPIGIPESSIKTTFPSELDDAFICKGETSIKDYSEVSGGAISYKFISLSFFRIRKLQSEVQRILYEDEELPRRFNSIAEWKKDVEHRLEDWWMIASNLKSFADVDFHTEFFGLNYNHALLILNGLSPKCFKLSQEELLKVADASKNLMSCYTQLYIKRAINYTWAAVHNLFMAGTSFLYSLYYSYNVRLVYPKEAVMKVSEECITVLSSLTASCDAARDCSQMFRVLTAAILKLRYNENVDGSTLVDDPPDSPRSDSDNQDTRHNHHSTREYLHNHTGTGSAGPVPFSYNPDTNASEYIPRFNWISRGAARGPEVKAEQPNEEFVQASSLEDFFSEVANLSPAPSTHDLSEGSLPEYALTPDNLALDRKLPAREGKRIFELFHQLPNEPIWDQFFTNMTEDYSFKLEEDKA